MKRPDFVTEKEIIGTCACKQELRADMVEWKAIWEWKPTEILYLYNCPKCHTTKALKEKELK